MTANPEQARQEQWHKQLSGLDRQLPEMQPLLRQMHLLSSNAVSAAARAGSEGDAFRVLTQAIQQLGQEISADMQKSQALLADSLSAPPLDQAGSLIGELDDALASMPQAVKKGEYLAICCAVEAAHADNHGDSFDSVATMLKQLVERLRRQVSQQQDWLERLRATI